MDLPMGSSPRNSSLHAEAATEQWHQNIYLGASHQANERRTRWVVALTAIMMVGEIAAGYLTGSMESIADGFHMSTHAGTQPCAAGRDALAPRRRPGPGVASGSAR